MFELCFERPVLGEIIGGNLDLGGLAGAQEGDVGGTHLGFDQQVVFERDDLQQIHAGADHAADRVDLELLDRAENRRLHFGAPHAVGDSGHRLFQNVEPHRRFVQFDLRLFAKGGPAFFNAAPGFGERRANSRDRQFGAMEFAIEAGNLPLQPQQFDP